MNGNDDPLGGLLGSLRRQAHTKTEDLNFLRAKPAGEKGLNPLDLLGLPEAQRDLVNYLSRKKQATLEEIGQKVEGSPPEILANIEALKELGYIREALIENVLYFRVVFGGKVNRSGRGMPEDIWNAVDLDNSLFLKQHRLFQNLDESQIKQVAAALNSRHYKRNEIIIWQGNIGDSIYFVKNGIVGVSRLSPGSQSQDAPIFAYLKQGDILAEHNLLQDHHYPASATISALSEVDVLHIKRHDFLQLLLNFDMMALELGHILAERLSTIHLRLSKQDAETQLALIFGVGDCGKSMLGSTLALMLASLTKHKAVYTEHPDPQKLPNKFGFETEENDYYQHPAGYDVAVVETSKGLPSSVHTTLVVDRLIDEYPNIVIGLAAEYDEGLAYLLEKANQVIVMASPEPETWAQANQFIARIKANVHPERTSLLLVANRKSADLAGVVAPSNADFDIPFLPELLPLAQQREEDLPEVLKTTLHQMADRLGRTNQIGIYIPTTSDVVNTVDTSGYVQETMTFLSQLFGGADASANEAHGVWNSDEVGLVSETIYIVRTTVTQTELDRYLGDVLEYVERLKSELKQEAMALEVNKKLMII